MSHDTQQSNSKNPGSSVTSSVWFMIILAFVFIAAVNFVNIMSHDDGGHGAGGHATEHAATEHHEATSHDNMMEEHHEAEEHGHEEGHH